MRLILVLPLFGHVFADIFMSNPKGSNNRLNEVTNNRRNGNRLFDSQNNAAGGYNVGDRFTEAAGEDHRQQYQMMYYASGAKSSESSNLVVEWTNQHGCGKNSKVQCGVVIQYMCMNNGSDEDYPVDDATSDENNLRLAKYMRDGTSTDKQSYKSPPWRHERTDEEYNARLEENYGRITAAAGLHESLTWYDMCKYREANNGLFRADQTLTIERVDLNRNQYVVSRKTRQNAAGTPRGFECPEERDYFPYWAPTLQGAYDSTYQRTGWIDAAYLSNGVGSSKCRDIYSGSFNQNGKYRCVFEGARDYGKSIHEEGCTEEGGSWVKFEPYLEVLEDITSEADCEAVASENENNVIVWRPLRSDSVENKCIVQAPRVTCTKAPSTRANHLGNAEGNPSHASRFEWDMPHFPSGKAKRCVVRIRYNITTADYDPTDTFSDSNGDESPITGDPTVDVFGDGNGLTLALDTAQFGRTFQDRSHIFLILPRTDEMSNKKLHNLNVRGQRGNLEQTNPSVEYDFVPDLLEVDEADLVHVQWAGVNTNVANRAGEGTDGTDRNNFVEMAGDLDTSFPAVLSDATFWTTVDSLTSPAASGVDIAAAFASSGYYCGNTAHDTCPAGDTVEGNNRDALQGQLNNAPASYFGHVLKFNAPGTYFYMCTRNNNFSNRSQKGTLVVNSE